MVTTSLGSALNARQKNGETIVFTKVKVGEGALTAGQTERTMSNLNGSFLEVPITSAYVNETNQFCVKVLYSNQGFATAKKVIEEGIFAKIGNEAEVLYAYVNHGTNYDTLPPQTGDRYVNKVKEFQFKTSEVGTAQVIINGLIVHPTIEDMNRELAKKSDKTYVDVELGKKANILKNEGRIKTVTIPPGGGQARLGGENGALKIELPFSKTDTIYSYDLDILSYGKNRVSKYCIIGYNAAVGVGGVSNIQRIARVSDSAYNPNVYFCTGATSDYLMIGDVTDTTEITDYSIVEISNLRYFYGGFDNDWSNGWKLSVVTSAENLTEQNKVTVNPKLEATHLEGHQTTLQGEGGKIQVVPSGAVNNMLRLQDGITIDNLTLSRTYVGYDLISSSANIALTGFWYVEHYAPPVGGFNYAHQKAWQTGIYGQTKTGIIQRWKINGIWSEWERILTNRGGQDIDGELTVGGTSVNSNSTKFFLRNKGGHTWAFSSGLNGAYEKAYALYNWTTQKLVTLVTEVEEIKNFFKTFVIKNATDAFSVKDEGSTDIFTVDTLNQLLTGAAADKKADKTYVDTKVASIVNSSPAALDTLNELAAALGNDANFATNVTNSIATKVANSSFQEDGDLLVGTGVGTYVRKTLSQLKSLLSLDKVENGANKIPLGSVFLGYYATTPPGFLKFATYYDKTAYNDLYLLLVSFGLGATHLTEPNKFITPETRADFLRLLDENRGIDPGRVAGSFQADEFKSHVHAYTMKVGIGGTSAGGDPLNLGIASYDTGSTGGVETRPRNTALPGIIKY